MKLHLPVRLFRAVVSLMVAVPIAASAAYTAPTEIFIPDNNTEVKVDELSDISSYASNASAVTFRIDATAFLDGCFTISSQKSALKTDASGSWCFVSDSADDLATLIFSGSSTRLFHALGTKGLVFSDLKELAFKSNSYRGNGGCIYGASVFRNNVEVAFINNASTFNSTANSAGGGAINGYDMEFVDNKKILFEKNFASHGGAICVYASTSRQLSFRENETISFDSNHARYKGGAIFGDEGCSISFSANGAIVFESNYASGGQPSGGAVYLLGDVELNRNKRVEFKKNYVSISTQYDSHYAEGGGVYASSVLLNENENVLFENNYSFAVVTNYAAYAHGGGIYASNLVELSNNKAALFSGNHVGGDGSALGGAIYAPSIVIEDNTTVEFSDNYAISEDDGIFGGAGGAIYSSSNSVIKGNKEAKFINNKSISGGAIYGNIIIAKNDWISFENNVAQNGGALYGTLKLTDNQTVEFRENNGSGLGGALYSRSGGSIVIANNKNVLFEKNCETKSGEYCLRSIYLDSSYNPATFFLSAPLGGKIEFRDSVALIGSASSVFSVNDVHVDDEGIEILQLGDVIFTGEFVEQHLKSIKGDVEISTSEMTNSLTAQIEAMTHLYDGRLIIRDGVVYKGYGITVHNSHASGPTLYLKSSTLDQSGYDVTMQPGSVLELEGSNSIKADFLDMKRNCSFTFHVVKENAEFSILNLIGCYKQSDTLTLNISFNDATAEAGRYKLMTVTSIADDTLWTESNVTVNGLDGYVVGFDDLEWRDNTLYLNYNGTPGTGGATTPSLLIATWTNEAQDGLWNGTSLNWEQEEVDYAYKDGVQVVFGDEGAGTVTLVGDIAPSSVLVDSKEDYTWNADSTAGGKLTGSMSLTKKGTGTLIINTENDYTGGTTIQGGTVVAGTATALGIGTVSLTDATLKIAAEGVENALTTAGISSILVQDGGSLALQSAITNAATGILTLSGKVDVSGIGELTKLDATLIDVNGNAGTSGFARTEGYALQVVQGGKVLASGAELVHSGLPTGLTLVLGENGLATAGATTDFTKYVVTGSHAVSVSEILKDVPQDSALSSIEMSGGTLLVDAATDALAATGGTVTVNKEVTLGGTMSGGMLLAQAGEIAATLSGNTAVVVSGAVTLSGSNSHRGGVMLNGGALTLKHAQALGAGQPVTSGVSSLVIDYGVELSLGQAISNSGRLSISGSIDASGLALHSSAATRVDVNGVSGTSGFAKEAEQWVQIVNGGTTENKGVTILHSGTSDDLLLGADGRATYGGAIYHDEYLLTAGGAAGVREILNAGGAELIKITMEGGTLKVNADTSALLTATDGTILLVEGGTLGSGSSVSGVDIKASGGSIAATLTGSNTLEGIAGFALSSTIANTGTLTISGSINADALTLTKGSETHIDVNGESGASGFLKTAVESVQLTSGAGSTIDGGVTITHKDATGSLVLGKDGVATRGGEIDYTHYLLNGETDSAKVSDIIADAGDALTGITVQQGTLTVDAVGKTITATGGAVVLDGGVLNGSVENTALTLTSGTVNASIAGGSIIGSDYALLEVLQVSGNVEVRGSFNASLLQLVTENATRIDVDGNSGASGFFKSDGYSVLVMNGGTLEVADDTKVKHGELELTLGSNGYATAGGSTDLSNYLLTGTDSVNVGAVLEDSANATITMNGGTLNVDVATDALTATAGIINLNTDVVLGGSISGAIINASKGTLSAALSGNNTLVGTGYALNSKLNNTGTLSLSGSFTIGSGLEVQHTAAGYESLNGGYDATNGFARTEWYAVDIADGVTADANATITYDGKTLKLGTDGVATWGGEVDYTMYYLNSGELSTKTIHDRVTGADITLGGGTLTVETQSTVTATGGAIKLVENGVLNGSLTNTNLTLTKGTLNAELKGGNTIIGAGYVLSEMIQNGGSLTVQGSFDASGLQLTTKDSLRVDVVSGNSGNSGFLKQGDSYVQIINGGTLTIDGAVVTHEDAAGALVLGTDGYARSAGGTNYGEYLLVGNDTVNVAAILGADSNATIKMQGGTLNVDVATDALTATAGIINLNTDVVLGGSISGATINASKGTLSAALSGNNTLVGTGYALNSKLNNTGTLSLSGTFAVNSLTTNEAATYIGADGVSGFAKDAYKVATIATGTTTDAGATITYNGEELKLNTDGTASAGGTVHYDTFWLKSDVTVDSDTIHALGANALVDITTGTLTVKDETKVKATAGSIVLEGGVLNGSIENTALTLTSGTVNATISGGSVIGNSYALAEVLQVSGNVSISGSFVADKLALTTIDAKRVDVVEGNSGASGFLLSGGHRVQIINGGTLSIAAGTTVTHGSTDLTLGVDGYATSTGSIGSEYLLVGTDAVNVAAILEYDPNATINMQGGTLTVDAATNALTATAGTVRLDTDVTLGGSISGATVNASAGTLAAALSGNNTLVGNAYALSGVLNNSGTLTMSGTFTVNSLTTDEAATYVGLEGCSTSGFAKEAYKVATIATGATADAGATITYNGEVLKLNTNGTASKGGTVDYSTFWLKSDVTVASNAIHTQSANALVNITAGKLMVKDETRVQANGGSVELVTGGVLNGSLSGTELTLKAGTVNASIADGSIIGSDYALSEVLQVSGNVSISGSFVADALTLTTIDTKRVDVVEGNSGNSGFLKHGDSYVQIISGDTLDIADGTIVKHGSIDLTLGADGYARSAGGTEWGEYLLTGSDKVSTNMIHTGEGAGALVRQEGGQLRVNDTTEVKSTSGEIILSGATLSGEVADTRVTAERGSIAATLSGITAVTITDEVIMSGNNTHSGVTTLADATLTITHANALGSGDVVTTGDSKLVVSGVTLVLGDSISNTGKLKLSGSFDASGLTLNRTEEGRMALSGTKVSRAESGFARGVEYSVQIVEGGKTLNDGVSISHRDYLSRTQLVLGEDGVARAGGAVDYTHFFLTGEDAVSVSEVDAVSELKGSDLLNVTMDGGVLEVDADITVEASGGSIVITDDSTLRGAIAHADITAAAGDYTSDISADVSGGSKVTVTGGEVTLSGANSYTGGTVIKGGSLTAGRDTAFGTGEVELRGGVLELNRKPLENELLAQGGIISGGSGFRGPVVFNGAVGLRGNLSARSMTINSGSVLTLNGSTVSVSGSLTLGGSAVLNLNGSDFGDGDVLITFGSLSGSEDLLTVTYGADSDKYGVENKGNALILAWLEEPQPEEEEKPVPLPPTEPEPPEVDVPTLDRERCDALVQSSWGVFTASHAFADAIGGQRSAAGYVGRQESVAWVSALGGMHRIDGTSVAAGSDIDLFGAAVGMEHCMSGTDTVGIAVGHLSGDVRLKNSGRETEQSGTYFGLYGVHQLADFDRSNHLNLRWSAVYGDTETEGSIGQEKMSLRQDSVQLNARVDWASQLNDAWAVNVFAGMEYFASESAENEESEEARVRMGSIQNLRGELGIGTRYTSGSTSLYGEVRYLNDMVRSNPYAEINGVRGYGANPGRQGIGVTLGAQQELGNGWSVHASYSLEAMSEATMHSANIGAALRF